MSSEEEILRLLREGKEERKQMRLEIQNLEKAVHNNNVRNQRIETKLIGDQEFSTPGLIQEFTEHKKETAQKLTLIDQHIEKEKLNKAKQKGVVLGMGIAGGGLGAWLKSLFGG